MRAMDREEEETKAVARDAISRVSACFASDPDEYDVRAAVIWRPPQDDAPDIDVLQFAWDDNDRTDYVLSGDPSYVVRGITEAANEEEARRIAEAWVGPSCRELAEFNFLPGYYQNAFVAALAGREPPPYGLEYLWAPSPEGEVWPVRYFPSGIGEKAPPIGQVGFILMPGAAVQELWRLRGW